MVQRMAEPLSRREDARAAFEHPGGWKKQTLGAVLVAVIGVLVASAFQKDPIWAIALSAAAGAFVGTRAPAVYSWLHAWFTYPRRQIERQLADLAQRFSSLESRESSPQVRVRPVFDFEIEWARAQLIGLKPSDADVNGGHVNLWIEGVFRKLLTWNETLADEFSPTSSPRVPTGPELAQLLGQLTQPNAGAPLKPNAYRLEEHRDRLTKILRDNP
jgi:hypothetical protein